MRNTLFPSLLFIIFTSLAFNVQATTYYVDQNHVLASDSNSGTVYFPWLTLQHAADTASVPGDLVYVRAGTYDERVSWQHSGSAVGGHITFAGYPGDAKPIMRGFTILSRDYVRIIGIEITHINQDHSHGIALYDADYCEILDNYIHHTYRQAIRNNTYYANSNYNVIRGNVITYIGCPNTGNTADWTGANAISLNGSYNLVEYNDASHCLDFFDLNGGQNIIRNNYVHDFANADFPGGPGDGAHVDFWQPFSLAGNLTRNCVVECNYARDIHEVNSHFFQVRDESLLGISELIIRGNVGIRFGSYVAQFGATDFTRLYNNTFIEFAYSQSPKGWATVSYTSEPPPTNTDHSVDNHNFNNIYYNVNRSDGYIIYTSAGSSVTASHNAGEGSGTHASLAVSANINFNDYANDGIFLSGTSDCINAGRVITTVTSVSGTGASFDVTDANFFHDGYSIVEGDLIKVGNNSPARITQITANTIALNQNITWTTGDAVRWGLQDNVPDIGAYEYATAGYAFSNSITSPREHSFVSGTVAINCTVTNVDKVRKVIIYINGIPTATFLEGPYTYNWDTTGLPDGLYTLEARAYSRYASTTLWTSDIVIVHIGDPDSAQIDESAMVQIVPNPANKGNDQRIQIKVASGNRIEVAIYNIAGERVHRGTVDPNPLYYATGETYYEYLWTPQTQGVYFAVITNKTTNQIIEKKKVAVK